MKSTIFWKGISTVNEDGKLEAILTHIGILTNIGSSHDEGFSN
jgi:alanine racemase